MGWTIILENEKRERIDSLDGELSSNSLDTANEQHGFLLLKYLDPHGDTIFNRLQIDDLIFDLNKLQDIDVENNAIKKIVELAEQCKRMPHTYLVFYGD